jgi:Protein of unknown function (DUF1501)
MSQSPQHLWSRREFLRAGGAGFPAVALSGLLAAERARADNVPIQARAKSCIFLFMEGGPSAMDLFDPKPLLNRLQGQRLPSSFRAVITANGEVDAPLLPSRRRWTRNGQGGLEVSDWLPHTAKCADDLAVLRSCWGNGLNHSNGVCQMNTGSPIAGRPSLGSWISYGLGTENRNLPAFVVMQDSPAIVSNGPRNWGPGFMPAVYQGIRLNNGVEPIPNLANPDGVTADQQRGRLDLLDSLNHRHAAAHPLQSELDARINAYELAFRMQAEAPEAVDLTHETEETRRLYGMDETPTAAFGRNCLLARRLVERGVRFVQLYHGAGSKWDAHKGIERNHADNCRSSDKPIAGLLKDLKRRGLLESTLVVWGGEFGRTPMSEQGDGRDHNPYGFTMWMAGGGVRGGRTIGATDEVGLHAVDQRLHVHDVHATILWLMGLDNLQLTYRYKGRPERPTQNEGEPYRRIVG